MSTFTAALIGGLVGMVAVFLVVLVTDCDRQPKTVTRFFVPPADGTPIPLPEGLHFDVVTIGFQEYIRIVGNNHAMAVLEADGSEASTPTRR